MAYQLESQKNDKHALEESGAEKQASGQYTDAYNNGFAQEDVKLDENLAPFAEGMNSYMVEADDERGFFQEKDADGNSRNVMASSKGERHGGYLLDKDLADSEGIDAAKKYAPNYKLLEQRPRVSDLVKEDDENGRVIEVVSGALETDEENVSHYPLPGLFIDDAPVIEDVAQMNIGDCYFLSAVMQILNADAGLFKNIMRLSGNHVVTTFYKQVDGAWEKEEITTVFGLNELRKEGYQSQRVGCLYRMGDKVEKTVWSGNFKPNASQAIFKITRRDYHKAAMWVYMLEQAYSHFAKKYGQCGNGKTKDSDRYNEIDSGMSSRIYNIFYGGRSEASNIIHRSGANNLKAEQSDVIKLFIERKLTSGDQDKSQVYMGASFHGKAEDSEITASHEYSVMDIQFVGSMSYDEVDLDSNKSVDKFIKGLDFKASKVVLRNPHIALEGQDVFSKNQGMASISLESFISGVDQVVAARIMKQDK